MPKIIDSETENIRPPEYVTKEVMALMEKTGAGCSFLSTYEIFLTAHPEVPDTEITGTFLRKYVEAYIQARGGYKRNGFATMNDAVKALTSSEGELSGYFLVDILAEESLEIAYILRNLLGFSIESVLVEDKWRTRFDDDWMKSKGIQFEEKPEEELKPKVDSICEIGLRRDGTHDGHVISTGTRKFMGIHIEHSVHRNDWKEELHEFLTLDQMFISQINVYRRLKPKNVTTKTRVRG